MKLTKLQRHTAYIILLDVFLDKERFGANVLCYAFKLISDGEWAHQTYKILPELYNKRDIEGRPSGFWFTTDEKRIEALQKCIKETA